MSENRDCLDHRLLRRISIGSVLLAVVFGFCVTADKAGADDSASDPLIGHTPITTAVRGVPITISATLSAQGGASITSQTVMVKVSDVGKPVKYPFTGAGSEGGVYNAAIPLSLMKGVSVFWYTINAYDSNGGIASTPWNRVVIIEPVESGSSTESNVGAGGSGGGGSGTDGGAGSAGSSGAAGGTGISTESATFIAGAILFAGGAALAIESQSGSSSKEGAPEESEPVAKKPGGGSPESAPVDPPCTTVTGSESVMYENLSFYCDESTADILVLVCGTCPDATISATTTWGASDIIAGYNNDSCSPTGQKLVLPLPLFNFAQPGNPQSGQDNASGGGQFFPNPGDETITILSNGIQVDQTVWPPLSDNDCL